MGLAGGATPITFHGLEHEDAEKFVAVFQDCALTNQWTSGQALAALPYFLREPARTAFDLARDRRLDAWTTTMDAARKEVSDQTRALDALQLRSGDLAISFDDLSSQMLAAVTPPAGDGDNTESLTPKRLIMAVQDISSRMAQVKMAQLEVQQSIDSSTVTLAAATAKVRDLEGGEEGRGADAAVVSPDGHPTTSAAGRVATHRDLVKAFGTSQAALQWFLDTYVTPAQREAFMAGYDGAKQLPGESVRAFSDRLMLLYHKAKLHATEDAQIRRFIKGLRPELRAAMHNIDRYSLTGDQDITSWDNTLKAAKELERLVPALQVAPNSLAQTAGAPGGPSVSGAPLAGMGAEQMSWLALANGWGGPHLALQGAPPASPGPAGAAGSGGGGSTTPTVAALAPTGVQPTTSTAPSMSEVEAMMRRLLEEQRGPTTSRSGQRTGGCTKCGSYVHDVSHCVKHLRMVMKCHHCHNMGHYSRVCPQRVTPPEGAPVPDSEPPSGATAATGALSSTNFCSNCGKKGHSFSACSACTCGDPTHDPASCPRRSGNE